ncbi:MAG: flagellar hook-length control protein FliK [Candidatus Jordarchaeum sp.]|uniref:flagellar hook-length control protein FliK n=1 Tax=Candidatus Jordarchaeum sp. TaxID=2823881 RepID=UPI0040498B5C
MELIDISIFPFVNFQELIDFQRFFTDKENFQKLLEMKTDVKYVKKNISVWENYDSFSIYLPFLNIFQDSKSYSTTRALEDKDPNLKEIQEWLLKSFSSNTNIKKDINFYDYCYTYIHSPQSTFWREYVEIGKKSSIFQIIDIIPQLETYSYTHNKFDNKLIDNLSPFHLINKLFSKDRGDNLSLLKNLYNHEEILPSNEFFQDGIKHLNECIENVSLLIKDKSSSNFSEMIFQNDIRLKFEPKKVIFNISFDENSIDQVDKKVLNQDTKLNEKKESFSYLLYNAKDLNSESLIGELKEVDNHKGSSFFSGFERSKTDYTEIISGGQFKESQNVIDETFQSTHPLSRNMSKWDLNAIYQQIEKSVIWCLKNNREKVKLILEPPELGHMQIEVKNNEKHVEIFLWAENSDTKKLLELNREYLSEILIEDGFKIERFEIYFQQEMNSFQNRHENLFKEGKRFSRNYQETEEVDVIQEEWINEKNIMEQYLWEKRHIDLMI